MTLTSLQGHSPNTNLQMQFFVKLYNTLAQPLMCDLFAIAEVLVIQYSVNRTIVNE